MTAQATAHPDARQEAFRWGRAPIADALDHFSGSQPCSQRQAARRLGVPHATFNYWARRHSPDEADPSDRFFRSPAGESALRRIVTAALVVFQQRGACGLRLVGDFLQLARLDRYVACSRGALAPLAAHVESGLVAFRDQEQPALARRMKPAAITLVPDEHFHAGKPCLVAVEPVSGFIAVECYREGRTADTWEGAIEEATAGMPVEVIQLTSDLARALVCCAEKGLQAAHSPDLFHLQRDLLKPLLPPLARPIQQAEKDLERAAGRRAAREEAEERKQSPQALHALIDSVRDEMDAEERLRLVRQRKEKAVQEVRGLSDDYHPFDRHTGRPVSAEAVGGRLGGHLDELEKLAAEAGLGEGARQAISRARTWVTTLVGCVAWFWGLVEARIEELELGEEQERIVMEKLVAGHYWSMAAPRARTGEEKKRLKELGRQLREAARRRGGGLSSPGEGERKELEDAARQMAGLFQRSSSCAEGRNGRLSLQKHGHSRVGERRLKALTVIHDYVVKRRDGTTAAERFFGQKHKDVFGWLLERMPDLPRPARKRQKTAG